MRRRILATAIVIAIAGAASAQAPLFPKLQLESVTCGPQALKVLQQWQARDEWRMKFTENESHRKFQGPTQEFGKWIQVEYQDQKNLKLTQFSEAKQLEFQFDTKCEPQPIDRSQIRQPASKKKTVQLPRLNDSEISAILKKKSSAIFFLWSPHMQISIEALREISKAANKLKIPLYAMVDPNADFAMAQKVAKQLKIPKSQLSIFDSFELTLRDLRLHYPSMVFASKGSLPSSVQRGHETAEVYENYIRTQLSRE